MQTLDRRLANLTPGQREILLRLLQGPAQAQRAPGRAGLPVLELRPEDRHDPFPLTEVQRVYWAGRSGLFDLGTCGTNVYSRLEISGFDEPPVERINHVFRRLVDHHEMLRAVVLADGRQRILAEVPPYRARVEDLRTLPEAAIEERLRVAGEEMRYGRKPIDSWPLFDVLVQLLPGSRLHLHMSFQTLLIDGTSRLRMLHEVVGLLHDPDLVLNPVECSYRDYALLGEELRESEPYQRSRAYWLARLPALPPAPRLPYAPPVGPATATRFASRSHALTSDQWQQLKARAAEFGLTRSAAFIASLVEVLALWSREADFTLYIAGTLHPPVHRGIETVLGNFNSCIPLPVQRWFGGFAARAVRLQEEIQKSLEHQHFPGFEVIREINRRKGGTSAAALPVQINSVIEYNQPSYRKKVQVKSRAAGRPQVQDLAVTQSEFGVSFPQFMLMVTAFENPDDTMVLSWQAVEEALPPAISADMFNAFVALIERLARDEAAWQAPRWEVARLLLPARQREQRACCAVSSRPEAHGLLQADFFARARLHPEKLAVGEQAGSLSYGELAVRALRIGRNVRRLAGGGCRLAGVLADSRSEAAVAILGILAAETAFVVVPPAFSREAISSLVQDYGIELLVIEPAVAERIGKIAGVPVLATNAPEREDELQPERMPAHLAYVALDFGDGKHARPRGAMVEHGAAVDGARDLAQRLGLCAECRWVAATGWEGSRFILELFAALSAGAAIIFPAACELRDPARLAEYLARERAEVWSSGPALFESVVAELEAQPAGRAGSLRLAAIHGGPLAVNLPVRLARLGLDTRLALLETLPEVGGAALCEVALRGVDLGYLRGRAADQQTAYVLNQELEPCPDWVVGDLYLGGATLATGYWNDPDATLSRFLLHPRTGERLLRTGKLARFLPAGLLEVLGAPRDVEAEIIGYWVELRQVETALERHPLVRAAVVLAAKGPRGRNRLVAHVVRCRGLALEQEDLRDWLEKTFPYYMVPAEFEIHDALPFTGDGAVDRRALRTIARQDRRLSPADERTEVVRDSVAAELVAIWRDVLGRDEIGIQDDFFAIGGDSVRLVQMFGRVKRLPQPARPLWEFFQEPTVEHLARLIRAGERLSPGEPCAVEPRAGDSR